MIAPQCIRDLIKMIGIALGLAVATIVGFAYSTGLVRAEPGQDYPFETQVRQPLLAIRGAGHRQPPSPAMAGAFNSDVVTEARRWIGTNPTDRKSLWCARFMNFVLKRTGHPETGSDAAASFANYGRRIPGPKLGAIAILRRGKHGSHVGIVIGVAGNGDPIILSGNHNRAVGIGQYPAARIYAYREL